MTTQENRQKCDFGPVQGCSASKLHSQKTPISGAICNKQNQCDRELRAAIGHSVPQHCGCIVSLDNLFR